MSSLSVEVAKIAEWRRHPDAVRMILEHLEESGGSRFAIRPDWDAAQRLEEAGNLLLLLARDGDRVVGMIMWQLAPLLECRDVVEAHARYFRVDPEWRRQGVPHRLIAASENALRGKGVARTILHDHAEARRDYRGFGYAPYQRLWVKELSDVSRRRQRSDREQ